MHFHYVLSMGALFSLIAAYYYWGPSMFGLNYNRIWEKFTSDYYSSQLILSSYLCTS